eukprot:4722807-Amphidinium_carterae.1
MDRKFLEQLHEQAAPPVGARYFIQDATPLAPTKLKGTGPWHLKDQHFLTWSLLGRDGLVVLVADMIREVNATSL